MVGRSLPATVLPHPAVDLPGLDRFGIKALVAQLQKFRPTVLHGLCEQQHGLVNRLAVRLDVPFIQTVNSLPTRWSDVVAGPRRCALLAAPTKTIRRRTAQICPWGPERVVQLPPGTVAEDAIVCMSEAAQLPGIVVAPGFNRVSDVARLFVAAKALLGEGHTFMVVVVGLGRGEPRLRRFLAQRGLTQAVTLLPMLTPWRSVLAAGDIFVQPQPAARFSGYLLEAMGLGMAVAACMGQVDDLIIPNQTAAVFEPGDDESIRRTLARLLEQRDVARRLARTAQEHVRARYSAEAMVSAALAHYERASQDHPN
jgi:glycosyltransferase involved in cell wall biosynthesis